MRFCSELGELLETTSCGAKGVAKETLFEIYILAHTFFYRGRRSHHSRRAHTLTLPPDALTPLPTHTLRRRPSSWLLALDRLRGLDRMSSCDRSTRQHPHLTSPPYPKGSGASPAENHVLPPIACSILQDLTTTSRWWLRKERRLWCGVERILLI